MENNSSDNNLNIKNILQDDAEGQATKLQEVYLHPRNRFVLIGICILHAAVISVCLFVLYVSFADSNSFSDKFSVILIYLIPSLFMLSLSFLSMSKSIKNYFKEKRNKK